MRRNARIVIGVVLALCIGAVVAAPAAVAQGSPTGTFPGFNLTEYSGDVHVIGIAERYTIRLAPTSAGNVEVLRPYAQQTAARINAIAGTSLAVGAGTGSGTVPAAGEIVVHVTSDVAVCGRHPDGDPVRACAGRIELGNQEPHYYIKSARVTFLNTTLDDSDLQPAMDHEMAHALGLDHYDPMYLGKFQLMRGDVFNAVPYQAGDANGLRHVANHGFKANPIGSFESLTPVTGGFIAKGWALDPNTATPVKVQLTFGNRRIQLTADDRRTDVGNAYPSNGDLHGFSVFLQAPPGAHTICLYAFNQGEGTADPRIGCLAQTAPGSVYFADVNDPGSLPVGQFADALVVNPTGITARLSDGSRFGSNRPALEYPYYGTHLTDFADVTGDGYSDAIVVNETSITVRPGNGGFAFLGPSTWKSTSFYGDQGTYFADVNGDSRADAIAVEGDSIRVALSTGTGFGTSTFWASRAGFGLRGIFFANVDSAAGADAIFVDEEAIRVRSSTGSSFSTLTQWSDRGFYGTKATAFADVDGDLMADAVAVNADRVYVRLSDGTSFQAHTHWTDNAYFGTRGTYFPDVTGDGRADAVVVNDGGVTVRRARLTGDGFGSNEPWTGDHPYYGAL